MLVLSRKHYDAVVVGGTSRNQPMVKVTVLEISRSRVVLGFEADADIPVHRWEVWKRISTNAPIGHGSGSLPQRRVAADGSPRRRAIA